jgi:hypothetical protein
LVRFLRQKTVSKMRPKQPSESTFVAWARAPSSDARVRPSVSHLRHTSCHAKERLQCIALSRRDLRGSDQHFFGSAIRKGSIHSGVARRVSRSPFRFLAPCAAARVAAMVEIPTEDSGSPSEDTDEPPRQVVGVFRSQPGNREVSVWYNSDFAWTTGERINMTWLMWCNDWSKWHDGLLFGLFATRIFQPMMDKIGQWILYPTICQECDRFCPAVHYWYGVCSSCWALGSSQVWRWLFDAFGGPPAMNVWRFAVSYPHGVDCIMPMLSTLLSHGSGLHPEFVEVMRHHGSRPAA